MKKIIMLSVLLGISSIVYGAAKDAMSPDMRIQAQRFKEYSARQALGVADVKDAICENPFVRAARLREDGAWDRHVQNFPELADKEIDDLTKLLDAGDVEKAVIEERINALTERWRPTSEYLEELQRRTEVLQQPCYVFKKPVTQATLSDDEATNCSGSGSGVSDVSKDTVDAFDSAIFDPKVLAALVNFGLKRAEISTIDIGEAHEYFAARGANVKSLLMAAKKERKRIQKKKIDAASY